MPVLAVLTLRWLLIEPFVIPSGSMIPTLLVHDHILVNKLSYGLHWPFSAEWILQWSAPKRGEIAVFRFPSQPEVFYVKRIVAVAGDVISMEKGVLLINGEPQPQTPLPDLSDEEFDYYRENDFTIRYFKDRHDFASFEERTVPEKNFFVVGDNRDQSSDSRFWGFVPEQNLIGKPSFIWLSCDKTLQSAPFLCDPHFLRWSRILNRVQAH